MEKRTKILVIALSVAVFLLLAFNIYYFAFRVIEDVSNDEELNNFFKIHEQRYDSLSLQKDKLIDSLNSELDTVRSETIVMYQTYQEEKQSLQRRIDELENKWKYENDNNYIDSSLFAIARKLSD